MRFTRLGQTGINAGLVGDVDLAEHAADFLGDHFAALVIHVEDGNLGTIGGQTAGCTFAKTGCAARDNGGNG